MTPNQAGPIIIERGNPHLKAAYFRKNVCGNRIRYVYDDELSSDEGVDILIRAGGILFPSIRCGENLIFDESPEGRPVMVSVNGSVIVNGVIVGGSLIAGSISCHSIKAVWITSHSIETIGDIKCSGGIEYDDETSFRCGGSLWIPGKVITDEEDQ